MTKHMPLKDPKTFENFDFSLLRGRDVQRLQGLQSLSPVYSHRNIAFIGPAGTGKTHLAQAFGYECCIHGLKTFFIKMSELRDRFTSARRTGSEARVLNGLVRPSSKPAPKNNGTKSFEIAIIPNIIGQQSIIEKEIKLLADFSYVSKSEFALRYDILVLIIVKDAVTKTNATLTNFSEDSYNPEDIFEESNIPNMGSHVLAPPSAVVKFFTA